MVEHFEQPEAPSRSLEEVTEKKYDNKLRKLDKP